MAKDKITEYDATANNNTVVGDVNLAENSALPSDMNNAIREVMSHQKEAFGSGTPLFVDQTNNRVGIGGSSPTHPLQNEGTSYFKDNVFIAGGSSKMVSSDSGSNPLIFGINAVEKARISSAGLVGISTSNPLSQLTIGGNANTTAKPTVAITDTTSGATLSMRGQSPKIAFDVTSSGVPKILMDNAGLEFKTGTLDAEGDVDVKIDSSGNLLVAKTSSTSATVGCELDAIGRAMFTRDGGHPLVVNRTTDDGLIIEFRQNNTAEGSISVSGTTVSLMSS